MAGKLQDKVAIVTGGSEGIGYGIAERFVKEGATVYLIARTAEKLERATASLGLGAKNYVAADIQDLPTIKKAIQNVVKTEGKLDIFVNNAGMYQPVGLQDDFAVAENLFRINMVAPLGIAHYLARTFGGKQERLQILNVASQAALHIFPAGVGYGTAKMGFVAGLLHIEKELQEDGIQNVALYTIYPGTVLTEKTRELVKNDILQNPTSLESVVDTTMDLVLGKTRTSHVGIGYFPGQGIVRKYLDVNVSGCSLLREVGSEVVDRHFKPAV